jgi:hypothetical protein
MADPQPDNTIWTEGDEPEPVTPATPLEGFELTVLRVWLVRDLRIEDSAHFSNRVAP